MKKIDLHIHTFSSVSDRDFDFSIETFERYVNEAHLDAVAVTNHNLFDWTQFTQIQQQLQCKVFPGIEVDLQSGHLLVIAEADDLAGFSSKCEKVSDEIKTKEDSITTAQLIQIFGDLSQYLLIPHYHKKPAVTGSEFADLFSYFTAGEVDSAKKFVREIKSSNTICPVLFSDSRMEDGLQELPNRQTFINCGELSLSAIKACLSDKTKIALSKEDGNRLFQVFEDGQHISTGLNVVCGERSSGKTVTLDRLSESLGEVKYIRQFDLVQANEKEDKKQFDDEVKRRRDGFVEEYLSSFRKLLADVSKVDIDADSLQLDSYLSSLLKSAAEADRKDSYSKVSLFDEIAFSISSNKGLSDLISSVINLIENVDYRNVIESHLEIQSLKNLAIDLINRLWAKADNDRNRKIVNSIIKDVKNSLKLHTSVRGIEEIDFYQYALNQVRVSRFNKIARSLRSSKTIFNEPVQGFRIVAQKGPYKSASELKAATASKPAFSKANKVYNNPYQFLRCLIEMDKLSESEHHRLFAKIEYRILNQDGADVSGGERSEYRLLQAIKDANQFDALLIDEPESSFDNRFLNQDVNNIIKRISLEMPVIVVTHNNSVGASIKPDYLIYAEKKRVGGTVEYRLYSGHPTDKLLKSPDGSEIRTFDVFLDSLEAGSEAYISRRDIYEAVKD